MPPFASIPVKPFFIPYYPPYTLRDSAYVQQYFSLYLFSDNSAEVSGIHRFLTIISHNKEFTILYRIGKLDTADLLLCCPVDVG